ncbi:unnamed protein product [Brassica napus]|uniref:VQ domain-containing protein n=2 Tax=Brassica TaxID=3705 RepID=A0A0D3D1K7_BRAOL|nr:unnamed protein product [Brassica napus]
MSERGKMNSEPMKVVFINTQYVETDARSFKNVVQELTGKDAIVAAGPFESPSTSDDRCYGGGNRIGEDSRRPYDGGGAKINSLIFFFFFYIDLILFFFSNSNICFIKNNGNHLLK